MRRRDYSSFSYPKTRMTLEITLELTDIFKVLTFIGFRGVL